MNESSDPLRNALREEFTATAAWHLERMKREHPLVFWSCMIVFALFTPFIWIAERIQRSRLWRMLSGDTFYDSAINDGDPAFPKGRGDGEEAGDAK